MTPPEPGAVVKKPLNTVAKMILNAWHKSDDQRLSAALLLKEAKERVEAGEDARFKSFRAWTVEMLPDRSDRDIRRLLQIANADDPHLAMTETRAKGRFHTASDGSRPRNGGNGRGQKRTHVSPRKPMPSPKTRRRTRSRSTAARPIPRSL